VLITGATGGIGGALAMVYAEPGSTLILQGRNAARLRRSWRRLSRRAARGC
jgi:short-subunit dehydrogenase